MIRIEYNNKEIKVLTEDVSKLYNVPLKLVVSKQVTDKEVWSCTLGDNGWASYPNNEMLDATIYEDNKPIMIRKWNTFLDGDVLYKSFYMYCQRLESTGFLPNGLAVGTHDGEFGEWVPSVLNNLTRATLIEASEPQYKRLVANFKNNKNVTMLNTLVTTNGEPTKFFEGGKGYTNSVVQRVIVSWEKETISASIKQSTSISDIINDMDRFDWLHLDVEGYDAQLIKAINPLRLPLFIIFENNNMLPEEKSSLYAYLREKGYFLREEAVSTLAIK